MKQLSRNNLLTALLLLVAMAFGQSAWAQNTVTLSEDNDFGPNEAGHWYVNMPAHTTNHLYLSADSLTTCGYTFKVYDDGGKNGNYSIKCNGNLDITIPEGYAFLVTGTLWTEHDPVYVFLRFAKSTVDYIGKKWYSDTDGEPKTVGPVTCDGNVMRIRFCSGNAQYAGFDLTVTVVDMNTDFAVNLSNPAHGTLAVGNPTAKLGETVTVTPTPDTDFATTEVSYTACSTKFVITPVNGVYSFTMPACDVSVDAVFMDDVMVLWGGVDADGSAAHPYVISNQAGWDLLISKTAGQAGVSYTNGKYFELATNISDVTQSVPSFGGHLDGKGHKITLAMGLDGEGLISNIRYASSISNLTVEGSIENPASIVGGFVASAGVYAVTFTNCRSSVAITSSYSGNSSDFKGGGFVGSSSGPDKNFNRCVFDGSFSSNSNNNLSFFPWIGGNGGCTFTNFAYLYDGGAGFCNGSTEARAYLLTLTEPAAVVRTGGTAIGNGAGIAYADGFTYGNEEYYIPNATVTLSAPAGIRIASATYNGNATTLNSDGTASFTMPATNITATITGFAANYIDADGAMQIHAVSLLSSSDEAVTCEGGWYAVSGDVTLNKGITFSGAAHLILTDGAMLNVVDDNTSDDINIAISATDLCIYGQILGTGTLNASGRNSHSYYGDTPCIPKYAYGIQVSGNITFCGGEINATSSDEGYGLAEDYQVVYCYGIYAGGSVTIIRGHVSAIATTTSNLDVELYNISATGVILDWRLPSDRITVELEGKYYPSVSVAEGKSLWNGTEVLSGNIQWSKFNNKVLRPCIAREIEGYGTGNGGWAFIASPVEGSIMPSEVGNIFPSAGATSTEYDLYRFNQSAASDWENYKAHTQGFVLENGKGYLCARKGTQTLAFMGDAFNMGTEPVEVPLVYDGDAEFAGYNLVGNPFTENATIDRSYYVMNDEGTGLVAEAVDAATPIAPCTGVIVQTTAAEVAAEQNKVTFTKVTRGETFASKGRLKIALTQVPEPVEGPARNQGGVSTSSTTASLDNAIVSFDEGSQLGKFYFGEQDANIYLPQGTEDYAIAYSDAVGEIPVNLEARKNGEYTITVQPEGVEMMYLHLIDNLTGADIDLLSVGDCGSEPAMTANEPAMTAEGYSFTAKPTDYASRFKLVFVANNGDGPSTGSGADEPFAFCANGDWIILNPSTSSGTSTLQVFDMLGRQLSSEEIHSAFRIPHSAFPAPGVYVLRLINGNGVRTQKIVVR